MELIDNEIENENEFEIVPESVQKSGKTEEKKPEHSKSTTEDNTKGMYDRFSFIIPVEIEVLNIFLP